MLSFLVQAHSMRTLISAGAGIDVLLGGNVNGQDAGASAAAAAQMSASLTSSNPDSHQLPSSLQQLVAMQEQQRHQQQLACLALQQLTLAITTATASRIWPCSESETQLSDSPMSPAVGSQQQQSLMRAALHNHHHQQQLQPQLSGHLHPLLVTSPPRQQPPAIGRFCACCTWQPRQSGYLQLLDDCIADIGRVQEQQGQRLRGMSR